MSGKFALVTAFVASALGCAPPSKVPERAPETVAPTGTTPPVASEPSAAPKAVPPAAVALVEPYLVAVKSPTPSYAPPPTLRGSIQPEAGPLAAPLVPSAPTATEPVPPPPAAAPKLAPPRPANPLPPAIIRLFEEERGRRVDDARQRLSAATVRAAQTVAEAKRISGFVKDGFVAQKQADAAEASARAAGADLAEAQKTLDEAQQRQRDARRDLEAAIRRIAERLDPRRLAGLSVAPRTFQAVPGVYRLAILGSGPVTISVQNGALGRRLTPADGEAGAWIVRALDPSRLRIGIGSRRATLIVRALPSLEDPTRVKSSA